MAPDDPAIGRHIRRAFCQGLTQQTLAERAEQEPANISHIERGAAKLSLPTQNGRSSRKPCAPWWT